MMRIIWSKEEKRREYYKEREKSDLFEISQMWRRSESKRKNGLRTTTTTNNNTHFFFFQNSFFLFIYLYLKIHSAIDGRKIRG
jgi:hypothetical protein